MTQQQSIDINIVLDRSGSMEAVREETISGFNKFLADQQNQGGEATLSLVQFDDQYEVVHENVPLAKVPALTPQTFVPRGRTALLDAMGRTIVAVGERLAALPEDQRPGQVLFVVLTDGLENASREFRRRKIFEMIAHQQAKYSWQFVFLGANQDAIATAASYGIHAGGAMSYTGTKAGQEHVMQSLSLATSRYRMGKAATVNDFFTDEEREENG